MRVALLIALAVVTSACGVTSTQDTTGPATEPQTGRLVVTEHGEEPCCYEEGFVRFLRIDGPSGTVFDGRWEDTGDFSRSLPDGVYRVTRYLRPCDGNCGYLDPPSERCSIRVRVTSPEGARVQAAPQKLGTCRLMV